MVFPLDDYTPYGYLDIPTHTRNLSPRGVVRSCGVGFRWHVPAFAGSYGGRRETYRAGFRVAVAGAVEIADFDTVSSPYHSKNLIRFDLAAGETRGVVEWHLVGEHALRATIALDSPTRVALLAEYTRLLSANGEWGESGLVGRRVDGCLVLQGFEDGEAVALWTSWSPDDFGIAPDEAEARRWTRAPAPGLPEAGFVTRLGERGETVALFGALGFALTGGAPIEAIMARGRTLPEALARLGEARRVAAAERARLEAEDTAFWAAAPRLVGDWPAHWRRGLVYDLETLRMMVRPPTGIYRHRWDAMQIHAPRVVLGETAIDALLLSYADPVLAQELMLGVFLDAPEANVPCTREDGTYNMVAADGSICGTGPQWGYPWLVLEWLAALRPDRVWLERLYPRLAAYLDWWLIHRRDRDGWLGFACSWESGQDLSPRFGAQPLGGGHPVRQVRPVDLHAALAHAAGVMEGFATTLGLRDDAETWRARAADFAARTDRLWDGARYADVDTATGGFTAMDDPMLLAPVALGVARPERVAALTGRIAAINPDDLVWPMFVWTPVAAARRAGLPEVAATLAGAIVDRAYRFWDARRHDVDRTLPGITGEYWPLHGRCGGEGYGWGAFSVHLLLHDLLGLAPVPEGLRLAPNLPPVLRVAGRRYALHWVYRDLPLTIAVEPVDARSVRVEVNDQTAIVAWGAAYDVELRGSAG